MPNGITIYAEDRHTKDALSSLLYKFTDVFEPKARTAKIPLRHEIKIPLLPR